MTLARFFNDEATILTTATATNSPVTPIASSKGPDGATHPRWSPYFGPKTFIGAGGLLPNAAGFIWGQLNGFSSFLAFTATTPSTATIISKDANPSSGTGVFTIKADSVTKINYTNSYFGAVRTIAPAASQVLVSFNATTGAVDTIAPLAISRTAEAIRSTSVDGRLVYTGHFLSIYQNGKNVAANGASRIEIDPKTGTLSSWR